MLVLLPIPAIAGLVCEAGLAGGPIDVRLPPPTLGLGLAVMDGFRALEGVLVLGVEAVDVAADSCFVGDLVGDCRFVREN